MIFWMLSFFGLWTGISPEQTAVPEPGCISDSLFIRVLNYDELRPLLQQENDTTYVVNFWATWCGPCVKELPHFLELQEKYAQHPFVLLLVSLDFKKDYVRKLQPFVIEHGIRPNVVVLEDNRSDFWINDIHPDWSGALPATLVYNKKQRLFYERTFQTSGELEDIVKPFLNL